MRILNLFIVVGLCFVAAGCSGAKEKLGLNRAPPDEFAVVKRAPLALPPDYALRPPMPGAPRPQEQAAAEQAKAAVFGDEPGAGIVAGSEGEAVLLQRAGAAQIDPSIRRKVDAETASRVDHNKPVVDKLLDLGRDAEVPATVVDPVKEAERIKANQEAGKPVTEGETPSVED